MKINFKLILNSIKSFILNSNLIKMGILELNIHCKYINRINLIFSYQLLFWRIINKSKIKNKLF